MPLYYILQQVGFKMGISPQVETERAVILRFVNEAAKELYHISDIPGCLDERLFRINPNQTIACQQMWGRLEQ